MILDDVNKKILRLLQKDARISNTELADKVNLSPTPCLRRLKKLQENGYIDSYSAILNKKAIGLNISAFVFVNLERNTKESGDHFEAELRKLPEVTECCVVTGRHDYVLRVVAKDLEGYDRFLKEKIANIDSIANLESVIILNQNIEKNELPI